MYTRGKIITKFDGAESIKYPSLLEI